MMSRNFNNSKSESAMMRNANSLRENVNRYYRWNLNNFPIEKHKSILDLGCGPAIYFKEIMEYLPSSYIAADYSHKYLDEVKKVSIGYSNCQTLHLDLLNPNVVESIGDQKFNYIFFFDVLEHLEDDQLALKNIFNILKTSGKKEGSKLFLRVPAIQEIYGENDRAIGHYRRYSAKSLQKLLESCSFNINILRYQNMVGIIPWYIIGKMFKRSLAISEKEGTAFNYLVPMIEPVERLFPPPFGLSLYAVCTLGNCLRENQ